MASVAACTDRDYGVGMAHGASLVAFGNVVLCLVCWLVRQQLHFDDDYTRALSELRSHFGHNVVGSDNIWWLFARAQYYIEIKGNAYGKITYYFKDKRFEYGNRVYYDIETLIGQIKKDRQSERKDID